MSHEQAPRNHEKRATVNHEIITNRSKELSQHLNEAARSSEKDTAAQLAESRKDVLESSRSTSEYASTQVEKTIAPAQPFTSADRLHGFNTVMHTVRRHLNKPEQTLSNFIHKPIVEKTSELASKTIARPSGLIGAGASAFIGVSVLYGIARHAGFSLSGSESLLLLAGGFIVGIFVEWAVKSLGSLWRNERN